MIQKLYDIQAVAGAMFGESIAVSFGNDRAAMKAVREGVALCDRSHWGRILVSDDDRLRFLHNQSTNDFEQLKPGQGCDTVFVTSTARTIDLATGYVMEDAVMLLVSPNRRQKVMQWLDQYIFFADKVKLTDVTDDTVTFSLIGPKSDAVLEQLGASTIIGQPYGSHQLIFTPPVSPPSTGGTSVVSSPVSPSSTQETSVVSSPVSSPVSPLWTGGTEGGVRVAVGSGLAIPGYTLIAPADSAAFLWSKLVEVGAVPMGASVWEQLRIEQGRPVPDRELTEDYNPLEAGLWQTISFSKGCYIGQETIARLNTYKGVKQQLWGIRLKAPAEPGSLITVGDEKVGKLTSYTETDEGSFGLCYIRTKAGGEGLKVQVGDTEGEVVAVPFVTHIPE
ncbi:YgfZ/GcvT domain-containing protein [Argonema galeatum]|uniref:CAF17-like 4Fe-4S cluster assembly/insertion protein YgfZ n=1 Tax=Argonema galeatum TaxID=2942762 RepID=UPI002010E277|nr:folate-binding protein [Argonema galeatum]MCL1465272.1 folate-binding protein [Argonema galeatum A003/A1]